MKGQEGQGAVDSRLQNPGARLSLDELRIWGEEFGRALGVPSLVTLEGELGAGKTTLAQAICRGVGVTEDVTSPTFALVNQYEANGTTIYHLDLYRLRGPDDLTNLGWDDIVNSEAVVLVEWPERAGHRIPPGAIRIRLEHVPNDDSHRLLTTS